MSGEINERTYPIQILWLFKSSLIWILICLLAVPFLWASVAQERLNNVLFSFLAITVCAVFIFYYLVRTVLVRLTLHYRIDDKFFYLKQGILAKQERFIPYGVIQNILINQDLLDRLLGLATLSIENASQGGGNLAANQSVRRKDPFFENVGSQGNKVFLPGLKKQDAEALRGIILQKMKDNPTDDNQSGL